MKRLKLFFACLLMAVLSIGQVWGAVYFEDTFSDVGTGSSGSMLPRDGWSGSGTTAPQYNTGVRLGASSSGATLTKAAMSNIEGTKSLKVTIYVSRYNTNANTLTVTATNGTIASATLAENVSTGSGLTDGTLTIKPSANAGVTSTTAAATWTDAYKTEFTITGASKTTTITFSSSSRLILGPVKIEDAASTPSTCTSEITITKADDPANGTFALDNSGTVCIDEGNAIVNVTATPAAHCHLASVTSTAGTIGSIAGNTCEITDIDADTEIGVTFAEDTKYVVTWNVNGNEDTKTNVYAGEKPVFPATPAACDATSTTFIGWATAPWTGKLADLSEKTVYTSASAMPDVDAAVTYYAVFAKSSGSASNLFSWAGGTKEELTAAEGVADLNADNSDYADTHAPYRVKWNGTGKYIIISVASQPGQVSAGFKMIGGGTTSTITVQEADDAEGPFTDVENLAISGSSNDVVNIESTQAFKSTTRAIKLYYTKGSNVGLGPISIEGAVSYEDYMTNCAAPTCDDLGTPVVSATEITYNSAKLTWEAVANADKYLVKFNGVDQEATSNLYFDATGLDAATTYTYQVKALAEEGQDDWCDGAFSAEANFTTEPAPSATLTLMENGNVVAGGSHTVSVPFALPKEVTHTCGKTFVGWDADAECNHAPTYAPGANFTFADQTGVTLYAVYANVAAGTTTNIAYTGSTTTNMTGNNEAADLVDATDVTGWSVVGYKGGGSNFPGLNKDGTIRLYYNASGNSYIEVTAPQTIASVALTMGELNNVIVKVGGNTVAISDGVYPIGATSFTIINGNTTNAQAHIQNIAVNFPGAQSNWATTCVDPLENPTFSLDPVVAPVNDKYEEAINVVITNNAGEGTIYYTTNGQNPTSASTSYTGAITLNTCGIKTIKAIVISDNNQSEVVTATYEMAIPIPSVSAADPYTEAEAVAVIDGGCYNNEDVYVTGTVASNGAAWYQNSGTYTITLENGFKFYYFYEGANEQSFTDNYIAAGDVLVAKGKLEKSGNTYRLAQGCYLVSRTPAQKTPIDSDIDNPITVADALGYIDQAATYDLTNVYVKGVASEDPDNQGTFNIHDADVDNTFQIYKGVLSQALIDAGVEVEENDTVIAVGKLTKYYSTYEMAEGGEIVVVKKYVAPTVAVTGVEVDETATVKVGKTVQLTATVQPTNATNQNVTWSVKTGSETFAEVSETGLVTGLAEGVAIIIVTTEDGGFTDECTVTVNPIAPANTDIITAEGIGVEGNSYVAWTGKTGFGTSSVYAGNSTNATNPNAGALQLRYNTASDKQSGIVLTESNGMVLKGLSVSVKSGSNTLNVYAKATAYSGYADLYSDDENVRGKLIGTVSATGAMTLEEGVSYNDNYQYIGMRSANGALYLDDITITWGAAYVPEWTDVRPGETLTVNKYYTVCLDKAITDIQGATLWSLNHKNNEGTMAYLEEETPSTTAPLAAGKPFFMLTSSEHPQVVYTGAAVDEPVANGALRGTLSGLTASQIDDIITDDGAIYMLYNNALRPVEANAGNYLVANRAYVLASALTVGNPSSAPGKRVIAMPMQGQTATGVDALNATETPVKMIIDGKLFILRGEKMYDATGKLVK